MTDQHEPDREPEVAINLVAFARERVAPILAELPAREENETKEAEARLANLIVAGVLARPLDSESVARAFELAHNVLAYYAEDARQHGASGMVH